MAMGSDAAPQLTPVAAHGMEVLLAPRQVPRRSPHPPLPPEMKWYPAVNFHSEVGVAVALARAVYSWDVPAGQREWLCVASGACPRALSLPVLPPPSRDCGYCPSLLRNLTATVLDRVWGRCQGAGGRQAV